MKLLKMTMGNFKGISELTINFDGRDTAIFGKNATGKTTLYDAYLWCLFDKDSSNRKDFAIKTLDGAGQELHNLEHEVELVLELNGRQTTLKKSLKEKWTKKRGHNAPEFSGHTTDFYIDGVPAKASEYKKHIASIVDEEAFRLLSNPMHFNEHLTWQQRREILMTVCGDITDADVIASDSRLEELPAILGDRSLDDHRKVIMARRTAINKRLEELPARIDEANRALPDLTGMDQAHIQGLIDGLEAELKAKQEELAQLNAGGQIAELNRQKAEMDLTMLQIEKSVRGQADKAIQAKQKELNELRAAISKNQAAVNLAQNRIDDANKKIAVYTKDREALRLKWHEVNNRVLTYEERDTCPACGQSLPEDRIQAAYQKVLNNFNNIKATDLADITANGQTAKEEQAAIEALLPKLNGDLQSSIELMEANQAEEAKQAAIVTKMISAAPDYKQDSQYKAAVELKAKIEKDIALVKENQAIFALEINTAIDETKAMIKSHQSDMAQFAVAEAGQKRIAQLADEEKKLGEEFEELERQLFLADSFTRAKVDMLEAKINGKFKLARFKLFSEQINGGLAETCETTFNGVPFGSLNNGMRINIGLDIISTLSDYYEFSAPCFIDNAEAINQLPDVNCQVISLYVSADDEALRIVPVGQTEREVA